MITPHPSSAWIRWAGACALALGALLLPASRAAAVDTTQGTPTTITSDSDRMISFRHQEHSWQTADGATHLMINRGSLSPGATQTLFTTTDGGQTWAPTLSLQGTGQYSTSDGTLIGNDLWVTYSSATGTILFSILHYDPATVTWTVTVTQTAWSGAGQTALNPAFAVDTNGAVWCAFVVRDNATGNANIHMAQRIPSGLMWRDTGLVFGTTDNTSIERSARPMPIPGGVGMVFTVHNQFFWAIRTDGWSYTQTWPQATLFTSTAGDTDPYASHFSVASDSQKNLHMMILDGGRVLYYRYLSQPKTWNASAITQNIQANYGQVSVLTGTDTVVLLANTSAANIRVFQSVDGGTSFAYTDLLTHPVGAGLSYANPRIEAPGSAALPLPVLQQYLDGSTQRLLSF